MTDIVERLRADNDWLMGSRLPGLEIRAVHAGNNSLEAAAEIERLREALKLCLGPIEAEEIGTTEWWRDAHNCALVARAALHHEGGEG